MHGALKLAVGNVTRRSLAAPPVAALISARKGRGFGSPWKAYSKFISAVLRKG